MNTITLRMLVVFLSFLSLLDVQRLSAQTMTLDECIELARARNARAAISAADLEIARATLRRALSGYWPSIHADVKATRLDEDPIFTFPSSSFAVPPTGINVPAMNVNLPAQTVGPITVAPQTVRVPGQTFRVPAQSLDVPEQKIKVMDRDNIIAGVYAMLPLYTGGLRPAYTDQARAAISLAEETMRRTDADLVYETTLFYYGAVLAGQLLKTSKDTLERMQATLDLTERMYQTGSGTVKKTDYLRTRSLVEVVRGAMIEVESRQAIALAALGLAVGADWDQPVKPADESLPFEPFNEELGQAIRHAQDSSPDLARVEAGVRAMEAKVREAKSGHLPKVGLIGAVTHIENEYDKGAVDPQNTDSWMIGIGASLPLFEGFATVSKVRAARAELEKMNQQHAFVSDAIAVMVQRVWYELDRAGRQEASARVGLESARENRELNIRAYQEDLVETKDVIEAQLMEAFLTSQHLRVMFEHTEAKARLQQISGTETF